MPGKGTVIILIIILLGVLLSGSLGSLGGVQLTPAPNKSVGILISETPEPSRTNLQLKTLRFVTPTPAPTIPPNELTFCGYGTGGKCGPNPLCDPANPRTCTFWKECEILRAFDSPTASDPNLHVWYGDEHALTLGVGDVSPLNSTPDHVVNPVTGDAVNGFDGAGRPFRPSLFITDITSNPQDRSGDWELGGNPVGDPTEVFGTWKALGTFDPIPNGADIGAGRVAKTSDRFVSEVLWNLSNPTFKLVPGHNYRLEFMLHDGDSSGDAGEKCAAITYQQPTTPYTPQ